jgi:prolyl-tRNA synthetase
MKLSNFYLFTLKEEPSDAFLASHKLMIRSGMVRQVASGIYTWLPLGLLVLDKIKNKVRKMHIENKVNELLMPTIQPADMWIKSGRFEDYGKEMLKFKDRSNIDLLYGPTNEEMITEVVAKDLKSYKDLPKSVFHVQWKFRDELRPRFGVMRCREFLMKDAYSFDTSYEEAYSSYCKMFVLYMKIFNSLGVRVLPVKADSGPIGGDLSHEFIIESNEGESDIFFDDNIWNESFNNIDINDKNDVINYVEKISTYYCCTAEKHNEEKYKKINNRNRKKSKGIEVGHIFYFGTKYSEYLKANYIDESGTQKLIHSGSYGIGISRLVGAIIQANYDKLGIVWPKEIAPFKIGLINVRHDNEKSKAFCENFYKNYSIDYDILYDDTSARTGEKFKNMDLLGMPVQVIVGEKNLENNKIEVKNRKSGIVDLIELDLIDKFLKEKYEL